jgi:hypothetical protein
MTQNVLRTTPLVKEETLLHMGMEDWRRTLHNTQMRAGGAHVSEERGYKSEALPAVWVTTDRHSYRRGEPILVTIYNTLSMPIYVLPEQAHCLIASVQHLETGRWEDFCLAGEAIPRTIITPQAGLTGALRSVAPKSGTRGPTVGEPSPPFCARRGFA